MAKIGYGSIIKEVPGIVKYDLHRIEEALKNKDVGPKKFKDNLPSLGWVYRLLTFLREYRRYLAIKGLMFLKQEFESGLKTLKTSWRRNIILKLKSSSQKQMVTGYTILMKVVFHLEAQMEN